MKISPRTLARLGALGIACFAFFAVFAELFASDLPIFCRFHGTLYVFPNIVHPRKIASLDCQRMGREKETGDWMVPPVVAHGPTRSTDNQPDVLLPPLSSSHPLGTDVYGRDVFARLVHGARTSLSVGLLAVIAYVALGVLLGGVAGFFGGLFDATVSRLVEVLSAFPTLIFVLAVQTVVEKPSMETLLFAIAITRWPEVARVIRSEVLLISSQEYVTAAKALGASPWRVLRRHVAANARAPILVALTFGIASVVLVEAQLSFLRVGVPPPTASWGEMMSELRDHPTAWWLLVFPGGAIFVLLIALNFVGEALREALDPQLRVLLFSEPTQGDSLQERYATRLSMPP